MTRLRHRSRMGIHPLLARRRVALAGLVSPIMLGADALSATVGTQLAAVVAQYHLGPAHITQVLAALLAQQRTAGNHLRLLKHRQRPAVRAVTRSEGRRLAFAAPGIADPTTSSGHRSPFVLQYSL